MPAGGLSHFERPSNVLLFSFKTRPPAPDGLEQVVSGRFTGPSIGFRFSQSKHAVLEVIRCVVGDIQVQRFDGEMATGLDSAASVLRCSLVCASKKQIALRLGRLASSKPPGSLICAR